MKIKLDGNKIIIEPEPTGENNHILMYVEEYENYIFQLQKEGNLIMLTKIGDRKTACNESINILYSGEDEDIRKISNLGNTPFEMDNAKYESVEGFWQSLKYETPERGGISKLFGKEAKMAGNREKYKKYVKYDNQKIKVGSREHWNLMQKACENKFRQNEDAQIALLNTGIRPLYHKTRKDSEVIPGQIMAGIWMNIRSKIRREKGIESMHLNLLK